jgi:hypothetical protein
MRDRISQREVDECVTSASASAIKRLRGRLSSTWDRTAF